MMKQLAVIAISIAAGLALPAHADWQPDASNKREVAARKVVDKFLTSYPEHREYYDQAAGYAVFPNIVRGGIFVAGAYGRGVVVEGDLLVGTTWQLLGGLGPLAGAQLYSQILFFKDAETLRTFKAGRMEFAGRASAVVIILGATGESVDLPDVAVFNMSEKGLMLEASANFIKYGYMPTVP